jgi:hypothetical protein
MKSRSTLWAFVSALILTLVLVTTVNAVEYKVYVNKTFGYSAGNQIRGEMSISVSPQEGIQSVFFTMDGEKLAEVTSPPFKAAFNTNDFASSFHDLGAVVTTTAGETLTLTPRHLQFVNAEQESQAMTGIMVPLLGGMFAIMLLIVGIQVLVMGRNKKSPAAPGEARSYGIAGGGICPKCKRPTPLHFMAPHLLGYRFDLCENCGKWSSIRRISETDLRKAEQVELESSRPDVPESKTEEEKLRDMLDKSRFTE